MEFCPWIRQWTFISSDVAARQPFHAANTPALKAEFGHPDVTIVYTTLAYYHDGLSVEEVQEAIRKLTTRGPSEQKAIYGEWFCSSRRSMTPEDRTALDTVDKVDVDRLRDPEHSQCKSLIPNRFANVFCLAIHDFFDGSGVK